MKFFQRIGTIALHDRCFRADRNHTLCRRALVAASAANLQQNLASTLKHCLARHQQGAADTSRWHTSHSQAPSWFYRQSAEDRHSRNYAMRWWQF